MKQRAKSIVQLHEQYKRLKELCPTLYYSHYYTDGTPYFTSARAEFIVKTYSKYLDNIRQTPTYKRACSVFNVRADSQLYTGYSNAATTKPTNALQLNGQVLVFETIESANNFVIYG